MEASGWAINSAGTREEEEVGEYFFLSFFFFESDSLAGSVKNMCKKGGNSVVS